MIRNTLISLVARQFRLFLNTQPDRFPSRSPSEINATLVRRSLPGAPLGTSPRGIPTSPYTKRYPYPAHSTSIDRFPSFIVIASPSVIATKLRREKKIGLDGF